MNLADAIRQAASQSGAPVIPTTAAVPSTAPAATPAWEEPTPIATPTVSTSPAPEAPSHQVQGNVVRLELFLSAEQMATLFKSVVSSQHSVMTLREAASYLRVAATSLEQLASEGNVPAFQVDGRWRFSKSALDDWLAVQNQQKKEAS
jgi:excisionase family DNA binding protein